MGEVEHFYAPERSFIVTFFLARIWAINANQLIVKISTCSPYRLVNPVCQTFKVTIFRAGDDSKMLRVLAMQPEKVFSIEREHNPLFGDSKRQNILVWYFLVGFVGLVRCQHVAAFLPQHLNDFGRKILVRVNPCHVQASSFSRISSSISSLCVR